MIRTLALSVAALVVALLAALLAYAATLPDSFAIARSVSIKAPPEKIFPLINDLQRWQDWSPWEKKDPAMTRTFGDTTAGPGASYAWAGNSEVGRGRMAIADSTAPGRVALRLDFIEPFEAHNDVEFLLRPEGDATTVSWTMRGPSPYIAKVMGVLIDCDAMVGKDFEAGLASLKALAER